MIEFRAVSMKYGNTAHGLDQATFAVAHVAWLRGYSETVLFSVLDADRSPERRATIADSVYDEVRKRVEARPTAARCSWRLGLLRIARR